MERGAWGIARHRYGGHWDLRSEGEVGDVGRSSSWAQGWRLKTPLIGGPRLSERKNIKERKGEGRGATGWLGWFAWVGSGRPSWLLSPFFVTVFFLFLFSVQLFKKYKQIWMKYILENCVKILYQI
jgi:hypothetical protein